MGDSGFKGDNKMYIIRDRERITLVDKDERECVVDSKEKEMALDEYIRVNGIKVYNVCRSEKEILREINAKNRLIYAYGNINVSRRTFNRIKKNKVFIVAYGKI